MEWLVVDGAAVARELVQRGVAAVYVLAFVGVLHQWRPLLGTHGLTPASEVVARTRFWQAPSLLRWRPTDATATTLATAGLVVAGLLVAGLPQRLGTPATVAAFLSVWAIYLSFVNLGREWFGFGWESLLCEAGFLVAFLGGHDVGVLWPALLAVWWLVLRVELGAGLIKLRGDPCWRDLTCLRYHHQTQPMPGPLSWWFHHLPDRVHRVEALGNHVVQLGAPWLLFLPQPVAGLGASAIIASQLWLLASGNFAWLNLLTIVLAASALPDAWFGWVPDGWLPAVASDPTPATPTWWVVVVLALSALLLWRSVPPVRNLLSARQRMNASHDPLRLVNSYGAFGSVTRRRTEVRIEGTEDPTGTSGWRQYRVPGVPGGPDHRPRQVAPYHLRLGWMLWFASLSADPVRQLPWFRRLLDAVASGDPSVRRLLDDPFEGRPPAHVRVRRERTRFTTPEERRSRGDWWVAEPFGTATDVPP